MPQTSPSQRESASDNESTQPEPATLLHPMPHTANDNDASEKPVREKLKKTSIATLSQEASRLQEEETTHDDEPSNEARPSQRNIPGGGPGHENVEMARGRPVKKRSFDDLEAAEGEIDNVHISEYQDSRLNGHTRKRSRDVRTGEPLQGERQPHTAGITLEEAAEETSNIAGPQAWLGINDQRPESAMEQANQSASGTDVEDYSGQRGVEGMETSSTLDANVDLKDHMMLDSGTSPRRKRSREFIDTDIDREQKIPATEEARAQRRSVEIVRDDTMEPTGNGTVRRENDTSTSQKSDVSRKQVQDNLTEATISKVLQYARNCV